MEESWEDMAASFPSMLKALISLPLCALRPLGCCLMSASGVLFSQTQLLAACQPGEGQLQHQGGSRTASVPGLWVPTRTLPTALCHNHPRPHDPLSSVWILTTRHSHLVQTPLLGDGRSGLHSHVEINISLPS